jgi:hypothetical protein
MGQAEHDVAALAAYGEVEDFLFQDRDWRNHMQTRTVTRTLVLVALMLNLGVAAAYAERRHVKMTFSGTNVATTINVQADTITDETLSRVIHVS